MSPPIYAPDGSEVSEIVLPDGSTASQVIGPDGNVVFEAGPDIPDSENLYANYDLQDQGSDISTLVDQTGNGRDANSVGSPTYEASGFNGHPSALLDGNDDGWEVPSGDWGTLSQPFTFYAVLEFVGSSDGRFWYAGSGTNFDWSGSNWRYFAGDSRTGSTNDTITDFAIVYDGANSLLEEAGTQTDSGDVGTGDVSGDLGIGHNPSGLQFQNFRLCQMMFYDAGHDGSTRTDVRDYLVGRWSI